MKKKILCIAATPYLITKGSSLRVDAILKKLTTENKVDLLTYPIGENIDYRNLNIIRILSNLRINVGISEISIRKIFLDIAILFKAFNLISKNRYHIIHCEDFEAAFIGFLLSLFFKNSKYVYDLHNTVVDNLEINNKPKILIKIFEKISRLIYPCFDLVISNWKIYKDIGKKNFLLYDESNLAVKKTKIPTKNRYLAYSGNFKKYQGVSEFLKQYSKVKSGLDVVLVGSSNGEIEELVEKLELDNRVYFTGALNIQESNFILKNAELCLIPRCYGKQPSLKMIHHIMLGKVSLASNIEANRELLRDGDNAILYSSDKELIDKLKEIDRDVNLENRFAKGIKETQKQINKIWSYEYFKKNYFDYLFPNEK